MCLGSPTFFLQIFFVSNRNSPSWLTCTWPTTCWRLFHTSQRVFGSYIFRFLCFINIVYKNTLILVTSDIIKLIHNLCSRVGFDNLFHRGHCTVFHSKKCILCGPNATALLPNGLKEWCSFSIC